MDYGIHPPTIYFPLVVPEALMIEPTETESLETLDAFVEAMRRIAAEAAEIPSCCARRRTTARSSAWTKRAPSSARSSATSSGSARSASSRV